MLFLLEILYDKTVSRAELLDGLTARGWTMTAALEALSLLLTWPNVVACEVDGVACLAWVWVGNDPRPQPFETEAPASRRTSFFN
jgi:hypothetical protein